MAQPFIGEIRIFSANFAPVGWALCEGQLLAVATYDALFSLLGTTYGGDGRTTFGLPDLRGRVPLHQGDGFRTGQHGGAESVTLTTPQLPPHTHSWEATTAGAANSSPVGNALATATATIYSNVNPINPLAQNAVSNTGGSTPHDNIQPYICINYIISLYGIYPSRQ